MPVPPLPLALLPADHWGRSSILACEGSRFLEGCPAPGPVPLYPLCQTLGEGALRPGLAQYVYQSFTTTELGASYSTVLGATTSYDQLSAWLLAYLVQLSIVPYCLPPSDEWHRIDQAVYAWLITQTPTNNLEQFPALPFNELPRWDHSMPEGHRPSPGRGKPFLREFGMELAESQTWPKLEKSTHTPLDPEFCMHQTAINTTFVQQLVLGVHQKLRKLEGLTGMDTDQLIDIAHPSGC